MFSERGRGREGELRTQTLKDSAFAGFGNGGALEIDAGEDSYRELGTALFEHWVLAAGHHTNMNDDGLADADLSINFYLSGIVYQISRKLPIGNQSGFCFDGAL